MKIDLENLQFFEEKMQAAGVDFVAQQFFTESYLNLNKNESQGYLHEADLTPVDNIPSIDSIPNNHTALLDKLVVIKLNGGLGTSMGLNKPKSLLPIKADKNFLDLTLEQIIKQRETYGVDMQFLLLNSFNSSQMTLDYLGKYKQAELNKLNVSAKDLELFQNQVPRIDMKTGKPANYPSNPQLEWSPPGHGDIYAKLYSSGKLKSLLKQGKRYAFISNMDNLGAVFDLSILHYMQNQKLAFLMEVCQRSADDKKGGHLAKLRENGQWVLRERAQCLDTDIKHFENIKKYQYFNTNNLWVDLQLLYDLLIKHNGILPLPLIQNKKQLDPMNMNSPKVLQLETSMGSALNCFPANKVSLLKVNRARFIPVKTINDWWTIRSDAYSIDEESILSLVNEEKAPLIDLGNDYKYLHDIDKLGFIPSLKNASKLQLHKKFIFKEGVIIKGDVNFINQGSTPVVIEAGIYKNQTYQFGS